MKCPGTGSPVKAREKKKVTSYSYRYGYTYTYKYKCPECGGLYTKKKDGSLNKHTVKVADNDFDKIVELRKASGEPLIVGGCANCGADLYDMDYLCSKCRNK